ncbi:DUF1329 domain-containing protein [Sinimarinibacterium thermocellulolyticum]|uniref:DUF1329 domain-containing protein n=1 Tax=Sinimarinibacterium thermocellulolyticum TaxID=3170016 RepID=A0ABV2A6N4_9GAMM
MRLTRRRTIAFGLVLAWCVQAVPAHVAGEDKTCMGAERAASEAGVAAYAGQWIGTWPGMKREHGYEPGPYADEKPLFVITAQNLAQHEDRLTPGQKALFRQYPNTFRMRVYPSHRDFGVPDWACAVARHNAQHARLIDDGHGVDGQGGAPAFPLPRNGLEAIWSAKTTYRAWTEQVVADIAYVYPGDKIAWGRYALRSMSMMNRPDAVPRPALTERIAAYFFASYLLPERDRGLTSVGVQFNHYGEGSTQAWQYQPGTRRVRQAPEVGYDYPVPPGGLHTSDEDSGFNGAPDRYDWTLLGKREIYVPYHNFRINDPALRYAELLTPDTLNPEYVRYELHRVWVVEAHLKPGMRHIYARRTIYIDEDSWQILTADHYDNHGALWRVPMILYFYSQESASHHRGVQVFHDLTAKAYAAVNLVNERPAADWWRLNRPMAPAQFSPQAAAQAGR